MLLPLTHNQKNKFTVARVHYSLDPEKNNPKWLEKARRGMTERGWNREYEIDYTTYEGKAFFSYTDPITGKNELSLKDYHISSTPIQFNAGETLYRGFDYGFHRPCCVITKLNEFDQWCWLKVILGQDEGIMQFGQRIKNFCLSQYPGSRYIDAGDPAGEAVSDKSEKTSVQILNLLGIYPQSRKQEIKEGAEIIRQKLLMRVDGKPGILIDPSQTDLIDMMKGGLHYPDTKEGQQEKEAYEKDGYYDHMGDCLRYLAVEMFTLAGEVNTTEHNLTADQARYRGDTMNNYLSDPLDAPPSDNPIMEYF